VHVAPQQGHPKTYFKKLKKRINNEEKDYFEHFELLVACRPLTHWHALCSKFKNFMLLDMKLYKKYYKLYTKNFTSSC